MSIGARMQRVSETSQRTRRRNSIVRENRLEKLTSKIVEALRSEYVGTKWSEVSANNFQISGCNGGYVMEAYVTQNACKFLHFHIRSYKKHTSTWVRDLQFGTPLHPLSGSGDFKLQLFSS